MRPHEVSVTCPACDESHYVPETTAEYNDGDVLCPDCYDKLDGLASDLFIRDQIERMKLLADYMESRGFYTKASSIRLFASQVALYEPVFRGIEDWRSGNFSQDREGLEKAIEKWDERNA